MNFVDSRGRPIVVVTGMGIVTSLGVGKAENWAKLTAGQSGVREIQRFSTEGLQTRFGGTIDFVLPPGFNTPDLSFALAELAVAEALEQAAVGESGVFPGPLFIAVPPVEVDWSSRAELSADLPADAPVTYRALTESSFGRRPEFQRLFLMGGVADRIADRFGTRGSPVSITTACASGASAVQMGVEAIRRGETSAALSVGTDGSINSEAVIRFSLLSALSTKNETPEAASRPFSGNRDGFVMAEGSGALVLESLASATARGATILGVIAGCGERATPSIAPVPIPTAGRSSARSKGRSRTPPSRLRRSTISTRTAPARRRTTRWRPSPAPPSSASAWSGCRSPPTSR